MAKKQRTADDILKDTRLALEGHIKDKKQNILSFISTIVKDLTRTKDNLEAGLDDPSSHCWTNMYGEVQNAIRLESFVVQLHGLVQAYKELNNA